MRNIIIIFLCIVLCGAVAKAQSNVSLGVSMGGNLSTLTDTSANSSFKPGFNAGAFIIWGPVEHWGFSGGIRYSLEGAKYKFEEADLKINTNLSYIRVPLLVTYFFNEYNNPVRPKIFLGPTAGFLVGGKNKILSPAGNSSEDVNDIFESFDLGLQAGAGVNLRLTSKGIWLNLDAGFYQGLLDVSSSEHSPNNLNQTIFLNAGITIPFGYANPSE